MRAAAVLLGVALTTSAIGEPGQLPSVLKKCPQERAVYSLGDATISFEMNPRSIEMGWGAVLRAPTSPIKLYVATSNGVVRNYFVSEANERWMSSEIELVNEKGEQLWGEMGEPAAPSLHLPGFGPRGTWRLTGCSKP